MLKGFLSLLLLFGVGILLFSVGMPKEFAVLQDYTREKYERVANYFSDTAVLPQLATTNGTETEPRPLIQSESEQRENVASILTSTDIIDATNMERIENGLEPLKKNTKLDTSANVKVRDMITLQYFEHESPSGATVSDLGSLVGYDYIIMGENLALGNFTSAKELVDAWMASPGHRANILSKKYQEIGVYASQGSYDGQTVWFAVQHFGSQKSVCPTISTSLKNEITALNKELANKEEDIEDAKADLEKPSSQFENNYRDRVEEFNDMVAAYNKTLAVSKQKTDIYNGQVGAFNICLAQFQ